MTGENGKTWRFRIRNCQVFYVMNLYVRKDVIGCKGSADGYGFLFQKDQEHLPVIFTCITEIFDQVYFLIRKI